MSNVEPLVNLIAQKAVEKILPVYRTAEAKAPTMHVERKPEEKATKIDTNVTAVAQAQTDLDKAAYDAEYAAASPGKKAQMSFDPAKVQEKNLFKKLEERVQPELEKQAAYAKRVAPANRAAMEPLQKAMQAESEDDPAKRRVFKEGETETLPQKFLDDTKKARAEDLAELGKQKLVTGGATKGSTAFLAGGKKVPTLSGGKRGEDLRKELEHTDTTKTYAHEKNFPDRQKQIEGLAEKADPFMRKLAAGGDLSATHVDPVKARKAAKKAADGYSVDADDNVLKDTKKVYGSGAKVFGNAERIVPILPDAGADADKDKRTASRTDFWSEADIDPLKQTTQRNTDRLIHTSPATQQAAPDSVLAGEQPKKKNVDQRFWVTGDHYKSAVPVAPVSEGRYVESDAYKNAPEKDKKARSRYADPAGKVNSLQHQEALAKEAEKPATDKKPD